MPNERARFVGQVPASASVARDEAHARQECVLLTQEYAEESRRAAPRDDGNQAPVGNRSRRSGLRRVLRHASKYIERAEIRVLEPSEETEHLLSFTDAFVDLLQRLPERLDDAA
jgi:hypothetical protein